MDLEEVWRIREEDVYPQLFGPATGGIYPLDARAFERFGRAPDPRWLHHGVLAFAPAETRPYWLYATSGRSNPWYDEPEDYDPEGQSGSGAEFLFATPSGGDWAIWFLRNMLAFDLVLGAGHYPGREVLAPGDRIPLHGPIDGNPDCLLHHALVSRSEALPAGFALPSGRVDFLTLVGATEAEKAFAQANGTDVLIEQLVAHGACPVTDPARASIL